MPTVGQTSEKGFGSYVRNLRRITTLLAQTLATHCLSADDLNCVRASEAVPAVARAFSKFMIANVDDKEPSWQVNETLNVFCHVLEQLGPRVTNDFFKDRIGWLDYTRVVLNTPGYYPHIYQLALRTLSPTEIVGWITAWLALARQSAAYTFYSLFRPLMRWLCIALRLINPSWALHLVAFCESMEQVRRGKGDVDEEQTGVTPLAGWLGSLWPLG